MQVEKKDGRRSSFTILGVASFANGDLSSASQNLAVIFKVCSASRVKSSASFFCFVFVFHVVHEATQTSRAFFLFHVSQLSSSESLQTGGLFSDC